MDQARNQVVWCRGRMGGVDVPHELVKVMSGILTSYPTKTRMSAVGPLNFYFVTSHPIPFHSIPFHSPKRTLELTTKRTPRRNKLHMQN